MSWITSSTHLLGLRYTSEPVKGWMMFPWRTIVRSRARSRAACGFVRSWKSCPSSSMTILPTWACRNSRRKAGKSLSRHARLIEESLSYIDRGARCHRASCSGRGKELVLLSGCSDLNLLPVQSANTCSPSSYFGLISFNAVVLVTSFHRRSPRRRQPAERLDYTAICQKVRVRILTCREMRHLASAR